MPPAIALAETTIPTKWFSRLAASSSIRTGKTGQWRPFWILAPKPQLLMHVNTTGFWNLKMNF
jgi:hypothetical protein